MQKFAYFVSMISIHLFSAVLELQLWLQFRGNLSWMSFLMLYDRKLQNWKCTCVDLFCVFNFPCTLTKKYLRAISNCIESKYKQAKHQKINLYLVVIFSGFSAIMWKPFFQRKHVGEVLGNVLWGSPKSDEHITSPHNSNIFENHQLDILSWCNTKFSKLESNHLEQLVWRINMSSLGQKLLCLQ